MLPIVEKPTRPKTRGDCIGGPRPCPWSTCRHWLPGVECALDLADSRGGMTLDEVGIHFDVSRERIRQIEAMALAKLQPALEGSGLADTSFAAGVPQAERWVLEGGSETSSVQQEQADSWLQGPGSGEIRNTEKSEREAEAFALDVFALRIEGVPLRVAWSMANGCPAPRERRSMTMAKPNGVTNGASNEIEKPEALPLAGSTSDLVEAHLNSRRALLERLAAIDEERAIITRALDATPGHEDGHPARQSAERTARKPTKGKSKPTREARTGSRIDRILTFVREHPKSKTADVAQALGRRPRQWQGRSSG